MNSKFTILGSLVASILLCGYRKQLVVAQREHVQNNEKHNRDDYDYSRDHVYGCCHSSLDAENERETAVCLERQLMARAINHSEDFETFAVGSIMMVSYATFNILNYAVYAYAVNSAFSMSNIHRKHHYFHMYVDRALPLATATADATEAVAAATQQEDTSGPRYLPQDRRWVKINIIADLLSLLQSPSAATRSSGRGVEYIVWLDADLVVLDFDHRSIFEELAGMYPQANILVSRDANTENGLINTGAMIVKNDPWSASFFKEWWAIGKDSGHTSGMEQHAFDLLWERNAKNVRERTVLLEEKTINTPTPAIEHHMYNSSVLHMAGYSTTVRKHVFREAWWEVCRGTGQLHPHHRRDHRVNIDGEDDWSEGEIYNKYQEGNHWVNQHEFSPLSAYLKVPLQESKNREKMQASEENREINKKSVGNTLKHQLGLTPEALQNFNFSSLLLNDLLALEELYISFMDKRTNTSSINRTVSSTAAAAAAFSFIVQVRGTLTDLMQSSYLVSAAGDSTQTSRKWKATSTRIYRRIYTATLNILQQEREMVKKIPRAASTSASSPGAAVRIKQSQVLLEAAMDVLLDLQDNVENSDDSLDRESIENDQDKGRRVSTLSVISDILPFVDDLILLYSPRSNDSNFGYDQPQEDLWKNKRNIVQYYLFKFLEFKASYYMQPKRQNFYEALLAYSGAINTWFLLYEDGYYGSGNGMSDSFKEVSTLMENVAICWHGLGRYEQAAQCIMGSTQQVLDRWGYWLQVVPVPSTTQKMSKHSSSSSSTPIVYLQSKKEGNDISGEECQEKFSSALCTICEHVIQLITDTRGGNVIQRYGGGFDKHEEERATSDSAFDTSSIPDIPIPKPFDAHYALFNVKVSLFRKYVIALEVSVSALAAVKAEAAERKERERTEYEVLLGNTALESLCSSIYTGPALPTIGSAAYTYKDVYQVYTARGVDRHVNMDLLLLDQELTHRASKAAEKLLQALAGAGIEAVIERGREVEEVEEEGNDDNCDDSIGSESGSRSALSLLAICNSFQSVDPRAGGVAPPSPAAAAAATAAAAAAAPPSPAAAAAAPSPAAAAASSSSIAATALTAADTKKDATHGTSPQQVPPRKRRFRRKTKK